MSGNDEQKQQAHFEEMVKKYPSLKKFEEMGDDYQESHDGREERLLSYLQTHPNAPQFRSDPHLLLSAMDDFASQIDFLINIGPHKASVLRSLILEHQPSTLIELGGYVGYSAILFALAMREAAATGDDTERNNKKIQIWSLEFEPRFAEIMRKVFELAGLEDVISVVVGPAAESMRRLAQTGEVVGGKVDLLFLDHVEERYESDLKVALEVGIVGKGGLVVADNVIRPGAPKYLEFVRGEKERFESRGVEGLIVPGEFYDEIEVTRVL